VDYENVQSQSLLPVIQVGQYQAEMASDSYQLQGMAERGFLPLVLAKRSKYGTPTLGEQQHA
jgi:hypothetical protein